MRAPLSPAGKAFIVGAWEHPIRKAEGKSLAQLHAEVATGALADAGLKHSDVDGYFCAGDAPGIGPMSMAEYLGISPTHMESTDVGGSSYMLAVGHAAEAIAAGKCKVALITLAGRPRAERKSADEEIRAFAGPTVPESAFELPFQANVVNLYAMVARRHMYEFGTTSEQLAWIKVAASHHAQHNPNAMLRNVVTVDDVVASPMIADPLHRMDCCVVSDGGGALVVVHPEVAQQIKRPLVGIRGAAEAIKHMGGGYFDLTYSAARQSAPLAFAQAGLRPQDINYASIYDSFTITVLIQLEDLGFCEKGQGGRFVADGKLVSGVGPLAINTDGGGLCSNHPGGRGGMTKIVECVRQLRGEAHPAVQVPNCEFALAHGTGGFLGTRHVGGTLILERV